MNARQRRMRVSIAVCEAPEQTEKVRRTFSHVSAGRTKSARSRAVHVLSGCSCELWFTLPGRGTLRGGVCGLSRSLPGAPRIAGGNEIYKGEALLTIDFRCRKSSGCFQADNSKKFRLLSKQRTQKSSVCFQSR